MPQLAQFQNVFTPDEDKLIIHLKERKNLGWAAIAEHLPHRSPGSLQVRYSRRLFKRDRRTKLNKIKYSRSSRSPLSTPSLSSTSPPDSTSSLSSSSESSRGLSNLGPSLKSPRQLRSTTTRSGRPPVVQTEESPAGENTEEQSGTNTGRPRRLVTLKFGNKAALARFDSAKQAAPSQTVHLVAKRELQAAVGGHSLARASATLPVPSSHVTAVSAPQLSRLPPAHSTLSEDKSLDTSNPDSSAKRPRIPNSTIILHQDWLVKPNPAAKNPVLPIIDSYKSKEPLAPHKPSNALEKELRELNSSVGISSTTGLRELTLTETGRPRRTVTIKANKIVEQQATSPNARPDHLRPSITLKKVVSSSNMPSSSNLEPSAARRLPAANLVQVEKPAQKPVRQMNATGYKEPVTEGKLIFLPDALCFTLTNDIGWIRADLDLIPDGYNVPSMFRNPPPTRVVEYNTRSGSYRIRSLREGEAEQQRSSKHSGQGTSLASKSK